MSILNRGGEDPYDAPAAGVDFAVDRRPDRNAVVRVVPWERRRSPDAAVRLAATARSESDHRRPEPSSVRQGHRRPRSARPASRVGTFLCDAHGVDHMSVMRWV